MGQVRFSGGTGEYKGAGKSGCYHRLDEWRTELGCV